MLIERKRQMEQLMAFRDTELIKVVTGVRRCGKSTLLRMFRERLHNEGVPDDRLITLNFEDFANFELRDPLKLHSYVLERLQEGKKTYLFMDEIQHVKDFPDVLNSLALRADVDIYVTGSNAYMLSGEIATFISGRYVEIKMLPLSFKEYCSASPDDPSPLSARFQRYITQSGFPYVINLRNDDAMIRDYLSGVYSTIILKDIVARGRIDGTLTLERIVKYSFDNIGNVTSLKRIADTLSSSGNRIDSKTIERYMTFLIQSFVLYNAERIDVKGGEILKTQNKYYVVDCGLRSSLLGISPRDTGHILENVVYLELLRRYSQVFIGKVNDVEIDFVAISGGRRHYFQVCETLIAPETLERETRPLKMVNDSYPKTILTTDEFGLGNLNGIEVTNVFSWLLQK